MVLGFWKLVSTEEWGRSGVPEGGKICLARARAPNRAYVEIDTGGSLFDRCSIDTPG